MMLEDKPYLCLGDGVYAEIENGSLTITVHHNEKANESIILKPDVFKNLIGFIEK